MKQLKVVFTSGVLKLEGRLLVPSRSGAGPGVVLCHPHPLYGGTMDNNVIHAACRALADKGITSLRFNFRGVGQSEGSHDAGEGEAEDALAALSFLAGREEADRDRIGLMGYSFGGAVALAAGMDDGLVKAVAAVSPAGMPVLSPGNLKPRLIVCGTDDTLVPPRLIFQGKESFTGNGAGAIELIQGADHFWQGREAEAAELIASFFVRHLG